MGCLRLRAAWQDTPRWGPTSITSPPAELPEETRTFARLCASLTEEAEAIGWYQQRLALEADREAQAIMRDAQGEEFKHFCMDLEFLLRRTPLWREIAVGILFQEGDIVEHGEESEEAAVEGAAERGEPVAGTRLTRPREPEGDRIMSHLLREHAPITATGWSRIDEEARERLAPALAARKLIDFAGPHGWQHSATNLGHTDPVAETGEGLTAVKRRVLPLVELRAAFSMSSRAELADADRGAEDVDFGALDAAARRLAVAENAAVFHGWKAAGITGIAEASAHDPVTLGDDCEHYPRHVAKAIEALLSAGIEGTYGLALGRDAYTRVLETSEHGGYPLLEHLREIVAGPLVWAPGRRRRGRRQPARRRLPVRLGRGHLDRLRPPRRRRGPSVSRRELQLPGRDAGSRRRTGLGRRPSTQSEPARLTSTSSTTFRAP